MPGSICDVLPAAGALLGVPGTEDRLGLIDRVGHVDRVLVVLVDGLGWHLLPELAADGALLASVLAGDAGRVSQLSCTFPSTTPTSLVSLGTGAMPGEHGILGFTVNVPGTDRVLNHIRWRDDPPQGQWEPLPTWFERLTWAGISTRAVLPEWFIGSGLTAAAYRGAQFHPTRASDDYAQLVIDEVRGAPGLVYAYTSDLDTAAHLFGIGSSQWHEAGRSVDSLLTRLVEALPPDAALLVTADHGGLNVAADARVVSTQTHGFRPGSGWSPVNRGCATCTPCPGRQPTSWIPGGSCWEPESMSAPATMQLPQGFSVRWHPGLRRVRR